MCHGSVTGQNWRALLGRKLNLLGFWVANVNFVCFKTHPSCFSELLVPQNLLLVFKGLPLTVRRPKGLRGQGPKGLRG